MSLRFIVTLLVGDYCVSVVSLWEGMGRPEGREAKKWLHAFLLCNCIFPQKAVFSFVVLPIILFSGTSLLPCRARWKGRPGQQVVSGSQAVRAGAGQESVGVKNKEKNPEIQTQTPWPYAVTSQGTPVRSPPCDECLWRGPHFCSLLSVISN